MTDDLLAALREVDALTPGSPPVAPRDLYREMVDLNGWVRWGFLVVAVVGYTAALCFGAPVLAMTTIIVAGLAGNMAARS